MVDSSITATRRLVGMQLRAARLELRMSQYRFALALQRAGEELGEPNGCSKRLVQKWESGAHALLSQRYQRALELVTGRAYDEFCESVDVDEGVLRLEAGLKRLRAATNEVISLLELLGS